MAAEPGVAQLDEREAQLDQREAKLNLRETQILRREEDVRRLEEDHRLEFAIQQYPIARYLSWAFWASILITAFVLLTFRRGDFQQNCTDELGLAAWGELILVSFASLTGLANWAIQHELNTYGTHTWKFEINAWLWYLLPPTLALLGAGYSLIRTSLCALPSRG